MQAYKTIPGALEWKSRVPSAPLSNSTTHHRTARVTTLPNNPDILPAHKSQTVFVSRPFITRRLTAERQMSFRAQWTCLQFQPRGSKRREGAPFNSLRSWDVITFLSGIRLVSVLGYGRVLGTHERKDEDYNKTFTLLDIGWLEEVDGRIE